VFYASMRTLEAKNDPNMLTGKTNTDAMRDQD
jgi:hypothetical protein